MATMFTPAFDNDVNMRDAIPGEPAMPSPTTASVAMPRCTSMPSSSRRDSSRANTFSSATRASAPRSAGTHRQIECSDDACEISVTEMPACWSAAKVRAAMPGTPSIPLPVTVTSAWLRTMESAFTG